MKARIKETGEIIDVECRFYAKIGSTDPIIHNGLVEVLKDDEIIDWEQRRYEIAKSMMAAFLSNSCSNVYMNTYENQAQEAVKYADMLIDELKKGK